MSVDKDFCCPPARSLLSAYKEYPLSAVTYVKSGTVASLAMSIIASRAMSSLVVVVAGLGLWAFVW